MSTLRAGLVRAIEAVVGTAEVMAGLALVVGVLLNFANVIGRYCFSAPIPWAEEVMVFLMIAGVFLGAGAVSLRGAHIRMDLAVQVLPPTALIWFSYPVIAQLWDFDQRSEVLRIPIAYPHAVIPLGLGIMILAVVGRIVAGRLGGSPHGQGEAH